MDRAGNAATAGTRVIRERSHRRCSVGGLNGRADRMSAYSAVQRLDSAHRVGLWARRHVRINDPRLSERLTVVELLSRKVNLDPGRQSDTVVSLYATVSPKDLGDQKHPAVKSPDYKSDHTALAMCGIGLG